MTNNKSKEIGIKKCIYFYHFYKNDLIKINNIDFNDFVLDDKLKSMAGNQKVT